jgi:hypothetical protein
MPLTSYTGAEARDWLKKNKSDCGLAGNRFASTQEALAFVEEVYAAGAAQVFVPDDAIRGHEAEIREHGGPYADSLVIELPAGDRTNIFKIFEREAQSEGNEDMTGEASVIDGKFLYLWWD